MFQSYILYNEWQILISGRQKKNDSRMGVDNLHDIGFDFESICHRTIRQFQFR